MDMHFLFPDGAAIKPRLLIKAKGGSYEVTRRRWLQFLALLTCYRLTDIESGSVCLEDIALLSSFNGLDCFAIGKYLSNTSADFPSTMTYFISSCLDVNTTGPYVLALDSDRIHADLSKLKTYVDWICKKPFSNNGDFGAIWKTANRAMQEFELVSSRQLFEAFIQEHCKDRNPPVEQISLAYILLSEIVRRTVRNMQVSKRMLNNAFEAALNVRSSNNRNLLLSYISGKEAFLHPLKKRYASRIIKLDQQSLDIAADVSGWDSDRYCLLGGRHYHRCYIALRLGVKTDWRYDMKQALYYYNKMMDTGPTKIVHCEPGVIEGTRMQLEIISIMKSRQRLSKEFYDRFSELSGQNELSGFGLLAVGQWLRHDLIKSGQLERAYEFGQRCLVVTANHYQTFAFQNLKAENFKLGRKLGYIDSNL